jgi:hypothetical protein
MLIALSFSLSASAENQLSSMLGNAANPLIGTLTGKLGVTQDQAEGGIGSMLKLAQEKLNAGDFDQVAAVIPGAQKYLDKAKALGAYTSLIGNKQGLLGAFSKLGINADTAKKFLPAVENFVTKAGGSKTGALFKSALS